MPLGPDLSLPGASNGSAATPDPSERAEGQTRRCSRCRETKPSSEFSPGHYVCKPCRREEWRRKQRQAAESEDEPAGCRVELRSAAELLAAA
jgi:hypothetical protein